MRTLIILAHQDDEALSCGGLIQDRLMRGNKVYLITMFGRKYEYGRQDQAMELRQQADYEKACAELGMQWGTYNHVGLEEGEPSKVGYYAPLEAVERRLKLFPANEVVIPSKLDMNQDHRHLHDVCRIALRPANLHKVDRVLIAHAHEGDCSEANYFVQLSDEMLEKKLKAVETYSTEVRYSPHPRCRENIVAHARIAGSKVGAKYAEPYTLWMQR